MQNPGRSILQICFLVALSLLGQSALAQAVVQASFNVDVITIDDTATLQILTDSTSSDVDFSPLSKDFDVIARSNSQQMQISNGRQRMIQAWVLELAPKDVGVFTIPPIKIGNAESEPVQITVTEASAGGARVLFLTAEVDKSEVFVQEQVILTVKVHEAVQVFDQQITSLRHDDLVINNLGSERVAEEVIDGQRYRVREQRFAIFPQKSGDIEIPQLVLSASIPKDNKAVQGFFRDSKWIKRRTPAITLNVKPRPDSQSSAWWLPAIDVSILNRWTPRTAVVSVSESLADGQLASIAGDNSTDSSSQAKVSEFNNGSTTLRVDINQPITRVIKIAGEAVGANQLPDIELPVVEGLDLYAEDVASSSREASHGVDTIQNITWAIVPQRPGVFELPEVRVEWFNTVTGNSEFAVLPPQTIEVVGEAAMAATTSEPTDATVVAATTDQVDDEPVGGDTFPQPDDLNSTDGLLTTPVQQSAASSMWKWVALAAVFGWIATIAGFMVWRNKFPESPKGPEQQAAADPVQRIKPELAMQELKGVLAQRDAGGALQKLLVWAESVWPTNPPRHIGEIASRLPSDELSAALQQLDAELYRGKQSESKASWDTLATLPRLLEGTLESENSRASTEQIRPDGLPSL